MGIFNSAIFNNKVFNTGVDTPVSGGGSPYPYDHYWDRVKDALNQENDIRKLNEIENQRKLAEQELSLKEVEIDNLELKRLKALADQQLQLQLLELLTEAQRLERERDYLVGLIRWMRIQEDDLLIILLSLPFVN